MLVAQWVLNVGFRQRCVLQKVGLFLLGLSDKDAAYRGTTDVESSGDFRLLRPQGSSIQIWRATPRFTTT
jgi:hypothetical protein